MLPCLEETCREKFCCFFFFSEKMKSRSSERKSNNSRQETGHEFPIKYIKEKLAAIFLMYF